MTHEDARRLLDYLVLCVKCGAMDANICKLPLDKWNPMSDVGVYGAYSAIYDELVRDNGDQ